MPSSKKNYIKKLNLITSDKKDVTEFISYERQAAIHDLIADNNFSIKKDNVNGPFVLEIKIENNALILDVTNEDNSIENNYRISINSLKKTVKLYHNACNLYFNSIKDGSIEKIEDIEKNRRDIHNEGADKFLKLINKDLIIDHNTARRLFTLLYSLYI
mgnify:CR=1 FL=1